MSNMTQEAELTRVGDRLKYIRRLLRLTRAYIENTYDLPEVTLKSWENETVQLTQAGLKRCVDIYRKEGLVISENWIMQGVGLNPTASLTIGQYFAIPSNIELLNEDDDEVNMLKEAKLFKESYPNAVVLLVSNDEMAPFYKPGDYVGGKIRRGDAIEKAVNKNCIVYLTNGEQFFRRLVKNNSQGYNLVCLNPTANTPEPVLFNAEIDSVAPIIWHRCKDE